MANLLNGEFPRPSDMFATLFGRCDPGHDPFNDQRPLELC